MKIGAQFFTIRDFCKTLDDFAESLKRVADIGYKTVQISKTCEFDPKWLKEQLDKNGLECVATHADPQKLTEDTQKVSEEHQVFGCRCIGLGSFKLCDEEGNSRLNEFIRIYKPIAKTIAQNGQYFMYHNHDREFRKINGKLIFESLIESFSADELGIILDTFWVQAGGADPAAWIERLKDRVPCIHLKDFAYGKKMAVIGEGNINFDRVFEKAESSHTKYMLVEQDDCNGENPFDCLKRSYQYLHSRGFE